MDLKLHRSAEAVPARDTWLGFHIQILALDLCSIPIHRLVVRPIAGRAANDAVRRLLRLSRFQLDNSYDLSENLLRM
jgi:hypothetical protein